ncbi:helix-turn-helix transcriptional regulator [uncultured Amphritea sp.]|jgi:predicted XRE-type DNA-binding protein|uniref:helix-turn-helix domain-containing protein n=1 Tax=uncultured Amphritea sp. TaxID=981605 RepID=UPI0026252EB4|nr:helix-turn-helix transcriptional regulator [uncultured Amphritea sp.]
MERLQYDNIFEAITDDAAEAADMEFRADMLLVIRKIIEQKGWTQKEAAAALDVAQPRVSELLRGKLDLFSADKLISFLAKLGYRIKPQFVPGRQQPLKVKVRQEALAA